jgi:hypothetical protein
MKAFWRSVIRVVEVSRTSTRIHEATKRVHQSSADCRLDGLTITKGSALEIPLNTGDTWELSARDFKGRAM